MSPGESNVLLKNEKTKIGLMIIYYPDTVFLYQTRKIKTLLDYKGHPIATL